MRDSHHSPMVGVIKALQQLHAGAFPAAAAANKGQRLAGFYWHIEPVQDLDIRPGGIRELAVNEVNVSLEIILDTDDGRRKTYGNGSDHVHDRRGRFQNTWLE